MKNLTKKIMGDITDLRVNLDSKLVKALRWSSILCFILALMPVLQANSSVLTESKYTLNRNDKVNQQSINGSVTDQNGLPLFGANVIEKGSTNGTQTNFDGDFTMNVANANAILVVSYIGFVTKEVKIDGQTNIKISLEEDAQALDEVVITGYGGVQRNEFVGATSILKAEELEQQPITTVEQGIKGRLAGVQVIQSTGAPGAGVSIRVRGLTSLAGGNEPLYVIDGIPAFNDDVRGLNGLSSLNPDDIASIEVLKDASSTAIYGSRAANGVVQITTKGGRASAGVKINYNVFASMQEVRKRIDVMNGEQYIDYVRKYYANSAGDLTEEAITKALTSLDAVGNANTNWQDEVYRTGFHQNHSLSVTGGSSDDNYYISANYNNKEGVVKSTDFERFAFRINLRNKIAEKFHLDSRVNLSQSTNNGFLASDGTNTRNFGKSGIGSTMIAAPTVPVYNSDGSFSNVSPYTFSGGDVENPVALLTALDRHKDFRTQAVLALNWDITDHLTNVLRSSVDYIDRKSDFYSPKTLVQLGSQVAHLDTDRSISFLVEDFINYKNTFGKIGVDAVVGISSQKDQRNLISLAGTGFPSDDLEDNAIQAATTSAIPVTNTIEQALVSFFGRLQLDWDKKYLLSLNARRDGSSVFAESNKYANFGAIGGAWRISQEDFMSGGIFDDLKLRASIGSLGNQAIRPYQSLSLGLIALTGQGSGSGISIGLAPNLPNPNLTWETTTQTNFGIDAGMFNNKIRFSIDYYVKITNDLLATVELPPSSGFRSIVDNVGKIKNDGFEIQLAADIVDNEDFSFTIDGQFSRNKNVVLETKDDQDIFSGTGGNDATGSTSIVREGESLFSFYSVKFLGVDNTGAPIYEDLDDNGIINANDRQIVGSPLPDFFYGFNTSMKYKRLSLITNWQGVSGAKVNNRGLANLSGPDVSFNRIENIYDYYPQPRYGIFTIGSDQFIEDASYLRLANVRLGYQLNAKLLGMNAVTIYVSGQNLWVITDYSGFDPEVNSFSGNDMRQGIDFAAYPSARTYTLGFNFNF